MGGFGVGRFALDEEPPEGVQVAAQDAQRQVTFQTQLASVATTFLAVAGLQAVDGRLDAGMTSRGRSESDAGRSGLFRDLSGDLLDSGLGQAG